MRILPIAFLGKNKPLNNIANLHKSTTTSKKDEADVFVRNSDKVSKPSAKLPVVSPESEKTCKIIANATSLICGGISAASGKAEAFSPGAWALRGMQAIMFTLMGIELDIPIYVAFEYAALEYMSGAYLGCEGSKNIISLVGIASDVASGGTSVPVSDATVRGINAGLSGAITKKMGNGFVNQVKKGKMNGLDQAIRLSSYLSTRLITGVFAINGKFSDLLDTDKINDILVGGFCANSIGDLNDIEKVKAVLEATPQLQKEFSAQVISHIIHRDVPKTITLFLSRMAENKIIESVAKADIKRKTGIVVDEVFSEEQKTQMLKQALLDSFITSAVYEMFDIAQGSLISKEAVDTVIDISENIHNYPEVFKIFEEYQDELTKNYNLGKISSDAFVNQFKNRAFLYNISSLTTTKVKDFARAWSRKENFAKNRKKAQQLDAINAENQKTKQKEQKNNDLNQTNGCVIATAAAEADKIKKNLNKVNPVGYSKIAGYDEEKAFIKAYLNSLSSLDTCDSEDLLNAILFYGPRGNGKTTFASALAEEFGCKFLKVPTTSNKQKGLSRLQKKLDIAKKHWIDEKRNSIILIDECSAFMNKAKNPQEEAINQEIAKLIEQAPTQYHATLFMTTNYPQRLDEVFLEPDKTQLIFPLDPPNRQNALEVFKHYTLSYDIDYSKLMNAFEKQCKLHNARYSNGQIAKIVEYAEIDYNGKVTTDNLIQIMQKTKPELIENDLIEYENQKKVFYRK